MDANKYLSERVKPLEASAIREIFKLIGSDDIISFAGGIPAPEIYPLESLAEISEDILINSGKTALQYGVTEGYDPLINIIKDRNQSKFSIGRDFDATIITTGAQQGIDLTIRSLVNDGEGVIVEIPSFIGTLNSLRSYRADLHGVPVLDDGMDLTMVEEILKSKNIKLIYTIPTFQNPTGNTMSLENRKKLLDLAKKYDCIILEDNPYGELRFRGNTIPAIKSFDDDGRVVYIGTFSKTLSPGIRVGFAVGHKDIIDRVVVTKQVNDVHTAMLSQMIVTEFIKRHDFDAHIKKSCDVCKEKCDIMLASMDKYFPEGVTYTRPDGGIFLWVTLPEGIDTKKLFKTCVERKVAFVPGSTCMTDIHKPCNCFRLNYTTMPNDKIIKGIKLLGDILKEVI